jgi:hypothetical protein
VYVQGVCVFLTGVGEWFDHGWFDQLAWVLACVSRAPGVMYACRGVCSSTQ